MAVYYDNDSSSKIITKSFSQTTYSDMSYECSGTISRIECYFDITSSDGYKSIYLGT
ncbi:MAG: hypothetical protein LUG83_10340 [Lachnospiraceae bacterium]|nr:hypothetical protein [Lachnospiraceae bacterium]